MGKKSTRACLTNNVPIWFTIDMVDESNHEQCLEEVILTPSGSFDVRSVLVIKRNTFPLLRILFLLLMSQQGYSR